MTDIIDEFEWCWIYPQGSGSLNVLASKSEIGEYRTLFSEDCSHSEREIRDFKTSNGGLQRKQQCLTCGKPASNSITRDKKQVVPDWDYDLANSLEVAKRERRYDIETLLIDRTANLELSGYAFYEDYLKSDEWKARRASIFKRDGKKCQSCLSEEATEVHHLTYERIFSEPLFDLVAICRPCHEKLHRKKLIAREAARAKGMTAQVSD
jgi:hypothetical protein